MALHTLGLPALAEQVLWFASEDGGVKAHTESGAYWVSYRLGELEERLPQTIFWCPTCKGDRRRREGCAACQGFGKLTITPQSGVLLNLSMRGSTRRDKSNAFGSSAAVSTGTGNKTSQQILTADGSWIINDKSFISFKLTNFRNPNQSTPDNVSNASVSTALGTQLDINNLDQMGLLTVPVANNSSAAVNAFRQTYIDKYGYLVNGVRTGSGTVGYGSLFDNDDFFRTQGQIAYNLTVNAGQTGFYRVNYTTDQWDALTEAVRAQQLPAVDRLGLQSDCWALVRGGYLPATQFLKLADAQALAPTTAELSLHLCREHLVLVAMACAQINAWNRLNVATLGVPGTYDRMYGLDKAGLN